MKIIIQVNFNLIAVLVLSFFLVACNVGKAKKSATTAFTSGDEDSPTTPTATDAAGNTISPGPMATQELYTKKHGEDYCVDISFVVKKGENPVQDAMVAFTKVADPEVGDSGTLSLPQVETDAEGNATTRFCSGVDPTSVTIVGKFGAIQANSGTIKIIDEPVYSFIYTGSGVTTNDKDAVELHLQGAGPNDCTNLFFSLSNQEAPVALAKATFKTQLDFPKGFKIAQKDQTGQVDEDAVTKKQYAYADLVSNSAGRFIVPVCAGFDLGTVQINASYKDSLGAVYQVTAPLVSIVSGLTYHSNLSLTFDKVNARTLIGFFNTNSDMIHPFEVKAGARQDGNPITDYPINVLAETGKITILDGGYPSSSNGTAKFTMQALHMMAYRPYEVKQFVSGDAQSRCDVLSISQEGGISYPELSKNWRSTIIYAIRGQEAFHDHNRNGYFDVGKGDGFWDKNQNGVFDEGIDVLTYDYNGNGVFDRNSEWFIDLPSPFIDVDEDGNFDPNIDILMGDAFMLPNGKRDTDTIIWKYEYVPIYMGESTFSITNATIPSGALNIRETTLVENYMNNLHSKGLRDANYAGKTPHIIGTSIDANILWSSEPERVGTGSARMLFHANGVCGNPPPGGTKFTISFEKIRDAEYGERAFYSEFITQPGDQIREESRRLLKMTAGANEAIVNFNIVDHPAKAAAYPIEFNVRVGSCLNACTGAVESGVACDAKEQKAWLHFNSTAIGSLVAIPAVNTCVCKANSTLFQSSCECDENFSLKSGACVADPVE